MTETDRTAGKDASHGPPSHPAWPVAEPFEVTFRDLDLAGHVNNSVVFSWMETLRLHHYMAVTGLTDPLDIDFILAEAGAKYYVPVRYKHKVLGAVAPSQVGRTSWELVYRFVDGPTGELLMRGRSVQVCYDYKKHGKKPIPDSVRERLVSQLVTSENEIWRTEGKKGP